MYTHAIMLFGLETLQPCVHVSVFLLPIVTWELGLKEFHSGNSYMYVQYTYVCTPHKWVICACESSDRHSMYANFSH